MEVGPVSGGSSGTSSLVEADVDGSPIWFRSDDVALRPSPEAFGSALLVAAVLQDRELRMADRVDPLWLRGARAVPALVGSWWGSADLPPSARTRRRSIDRPRPGGALCFTCGVDSFHALAHAEPAPDLLVHAAGYDIALEDEARLADVTGRIRDVAEHRGIDAVVISTNLRLHPSFAPVNWERSHGGALAALGHLLADRVGALTIASSFTVEHARPWGSRWDLDPLWSSTTTTVRHVGQERRREDKIGDLVDDPLVRQHLQVCWEHRSRLGNCGRCDKCVVTAVGMAASGRQVDGFPAGDELLDAIESLPATRYANSYRRIVDGGSLPSHLREAARSLLTRSA